MKREALLWVGVMSLITYIFIILASLMPSGCSIINNLTPEHPDDAADACERLCEMLERYGCQGKLGSPGPDETFGTEDDVSCRKQCEDSVLVAPWLFDKVVCGAEANNCREIDMCMENNP